MKLTGNCKVEFEKWYRVNIELFYNLQSNMQYGVLVDFFDSNYIFIDIDTESIMEGEHISFTIDCEGHSGGDEYFKTRPKARTKAIEKANEIYNGRLR